MSAIGTGLGDLWIPLGLPPAVMLVTLVLARFESRVLGDRVLGDRREPTVASEEYRDVRVPGAPTVPVPAAPPDVPAVAGDEHWEVMSPALAGAPPAVLPGRAR